MMDKKEDLGCQEDNSSSDDDDDDDTPNPVVGKCAYIKEFYRCLILLNAQETSDEEQRVSVAKDYFQNSAEICYLGEYGNSIVAYHDQIIKEITEYR